MTPGLTGTRYKLLAFLSAFMAAGVITLFLLNWADSRATPVISISSTPRSEIAIDVRGAISTPGVVYLPPGSRMIDVITASGGFQPDANQHLVNLSSRVSDGQMVVIPTVAPESSQVAGLVNINSAGVDELQSLPGIGEVYATRIVAYRSLNGPFQSIDELTNVEGISQSLLDSLRESITVDSGG